MKKLTTVAKALNHQKQFLLLGCFSLFNLLLVVARISISGYITFAFLIWNLFLAWIPFLTSTFLIKYCQRRKNWLVVTFLLGLWLAFLPNAPYILTDLIHLKPRPGIPFFYDLIMLLSFGLNGLILALISLEHVHDVLARVVPQKWANLGISFVLFLTSYGIYLGRVLRWNSWDLLFNPKSILRTAFYETIYQGLRSTASYMTVMFFVFLSLNYFGFRLLKQRR